MIMQTTSSEDSSIHLSSSDDYPPPITPTKLNEHEPSSPTDVRAYHHSESISYEDDDDVEIGDDEEEDFNNISARLGDLPIVREGSILDDEDDNHILMGGCGMMEEDELGDDEEMDEEIGNHFLEYQKEQDEMKREMNLNKIAFAAYRAAVLHLVHNQVYDKKYGNSDADEKKREEDMSQSPSMDENDNDTDTVNTYDEANERMVLLEEKAREIVENKAKACRDALEVHAEFEKRREEKRLRQKMLLGGLAGIGGGEDNMLAELRKMKQAKTTVKKNNGKAPESKKPATATTKSTPTKPSKTVSKPKPQLSKPSSKTAQTTTRKKSALSGPNVPLKTKLKRNTDCIKHTLPKFQYRQNDNQQNDDNESSESQPAKYRTTAWIGGMVRWRIQRFEYEELTLKKCGCPDCNVDLKSLYDKQKNSTTLRQ